MVARWKPILGEDFDLGIGLNTGTARVGNTGTVRKFKYGPLGTTVNLASRVQGATKHFKARLIITGQTKGRHRGRLRHQAARQGPRGQHRQEPVELYELVSGRSSGTGRTIQARPTSRRSSALRGRTGLI